MKVALAILLSFVLIIVWVKLVDMFWTACEKIDQIHAKLYGKSEPDKHPLAGLTKDPEEES